MTKDRATILAEQEARTRFCPVINGMCVGKKCVCWDLFYFDPLSSPGKGWDHHGAGVGCRHADINSPITGLHGYEKEQG